MVTRVVIIEDEIPAAERLRAWLERERKEITVVAVLVSVAEGLTYFANHPSPDLVFSDIELADGLCFQLFEKLNLQCPVIFTTAYSQYAINVFETHAIDYLLKPLKHEAISKALERFQARRFSKGVDYAKLSAEIEKNQQVSDTSYLVKYGQKRNYVNLMDASYFLSEFKSTTMIMDDGRNLPIDDTLNAIEARIPETHFFRINRNLLVNRSVIGEMAAMSKGRLMLKLHPPVPKSNYAVVSSERAPAFRHWLTSP